MARRKREQNIFFPWERRGDIMRLPWARSRPMLAALGMIVLLLLLGMRARTQTGVRSTRATILTVRHAIDNYRADHKGRCPSSLSALNKEGYLAIEPTDAWGRLLRLTCPGRRNPGEYDLISLGPSGDLRGLHRIE